MKTIQKRVKIGTMTDCRAKANAWAAGEDEDVQEAIYKYLLIHSRCLRNNDLAVLQLANNALDLYAGLAKQRIPATDSEPSAGEGNLAFPCITTRPGRSNRTQGKE